MKYLAVLGRQPEISIAELETATGTKWHQMPFSGRPTNLVWAGDGSGGDPKNVLALAKNFWGGKEPAGPAQAINRLGGTLKLAVELDGKPLEFLQGLPEGKITLGVSDYSEGATRRSAMDEALKLKKILVRHGRSVRVVENKEAILSTATSLHNGLNGKNARKVELIKVGHDWYRVIGVQDIDAYARRDQSRPARDAKVGMLPPKLAQILINLCGPLPPGATILDPFCGTGVVLQEALLMGYRAYGTDINERMIEYSSKNLQWLSEKILFSGAVRRLRPRKEGASPVTTGASDPSPENTYFSLNQGDATSYQWRQPINAVACEGYLGKPLTKPPTETELKDQQQECKSIITGFLKNLATQIKPDTPVVIAIPAWLRPDGTYARLKILAILDKLGYNVNNKSLDGLIYHREGQVVARDIIILRKK